MIPGEGVSERFRKAARAVVADLPTAEFDLLPARLAEVAAEVLGVAGTGLSLFADDFRLPLGASGPDAAVAERLQFTVRQGPCWDAAGHDTALAADADAVAVVWPQFHLEFVRRTPYRSVASTPLRLSRGVGGALDLYFTGPHEASSFDLDDAVAVAAHLAETLNRASDDHVPPLTGALGGPRWLRTDAARARTTVWIAAGMLVNDDDVASAGDGVALLRAAAYSEDRSVDEVAADLVAGARTPGDLRGDGAGGGDA